MKRSEKEAEVRRLLETPGAVVLLPAGMSVRDIRALTYDGLVERLVREAEPEDGWESEYPLPTRLAIASDGRRIVADNGPDDGNNWWIAEIIKPENPRHPGSSWCKQVVRKAVDAYNAMKEEEEAEADPNDPLTVALERVAAEEVAKLIEDAVEVAMEETLKECVAKCTSKYTREEFVQLEVQVALGPDNAGDVEDIDPDALAAIRCRAKWNAQAAERAGVVSRHQSAKVVCRNCSGYEWPEKLSDNGECRKCAERRLRKMEALGLSAPATSNKAEEQVGSKVLWEVGQTNYWPFKVTADGQCWVQVDDFWQNHNDAHPAMKELARILVEQDARQQTKSAEKSPATSNKAWMHYCDSGLAANHTMPRETFNAGFDYGYRAGWRARMDTLNPVCSPEAVDETLATEEVKEIASRLDQHTSSSAVSIALLRESIDGAYDRLQLHDGRITQVESDIECYGGKKTWDLLRKHEARLDALQRDDKEHHWQREQLSVLKAPIGALSPEPRTEPLPATCCGCICHVCANGHDTGTRPHSVDCRDHVLGHRLRGWKEREA